MSNRKKFPSRNNPSGSPPRSRKQKQKVTTRRKPTTFRERPNSPKPSNVHTRAISSFSPKMKNEIKRPTIPKRQNRIPKSIPKSKSKIGRHGSSPPRLPPKQMPEIYHKMKKAKVTKSKLLKEFLDTEETFVSQLEIFEKYYINRLNDTNMIDNKLYKSIVSEIKTILPINQMFLNDMKKDGGKCMESLVSFSEVLINFSYCFKLYSVYISKYHEIMDLVIKERSQNETFRDFLKFTTNKLKKEKCRIKDINGYLILPVQRIPRYKLLVDNLIHEIEKTNRTHTQDYKKLCQASVTINKIVQYCNDKTKEFQHDWKITELSHIINIKELVQPFRHLLLIEEEDVKCSVVDKFKLKPCKMYLFSDIFVCLVEHSKSKVQTIAINFRNNFGLFNDDDANEGLIFHSEKKNVCLKVYFKSEKDKNRWREKIEDQIIQTKRSIKKKVDITSKRKAGVKELFTSGVSGPSRFDELLGMKNMFMSDVNSEFD